MCTVPAPLGHSGHGCYFASQFGFPAAATAFNRFGVQAGGPEFSPRPLPNRDLKPTQQYPPPLPLPGPSGAACGVDPLIADPIFIGEATHAHTECRPHGAGADSYCWVPTSPPP